MGCGHGLSPHPGSDPWGQSCRKLAEWYEESTHSWLLLHLLWGWRGCLEVKLVELTLGRSTARHGARSLASCLASCAESTRLCYVQCAKVKLERISQINCGDRKR